MLFDLLDGRKTSSITRRIWNFSYVQAALGEQCVAQNGMCLPAVLAMTVTRRPQPHCIW